MRIEVTDYPLPVAFQFIDTDNQPWFYEDATTAEQWHESIGRVPLSRVVAAPGTAASVEDAITITERGWPTEWVNGTLVRKAVGFSKALVTTRLTCEVMNVVRDDDLGEVTGPAAPFACVTVTCGCPTCVLSTATTSRRSTTPTSGHPRCPRRLRPRCSATRPPRPRCGSRSASTSTAARGWSG